MSESVTQLSDSQKNCLRLVGQGMSSKEIAIRTGLAPQTVDTYLKLAIRYLGATNRREAARMLASWELSQISGSPPEAVANDPADGDQASAASERQWTGDLLPPQVGGIRNDLNMAQRTYAVLKVAAISSAAVIALVLLIAGVFRTFR